MKPLVAGCINPLVKKRLLEGIDEGCNEQTEADVICNAFRVQLRALPECEEHYPRAPEPRYEPPAPVYIPPPAPSYQTVERTKVKVLTDYQKHMSMCLRDKDASFNICLGKWKEPESRMDKDYVPRE